MPVLMKNKRKPIRLITTNKKNERVTVYLYSVIGKDKKEQDEFRQVRQVVPAENKSKAISCAVSLENKQRSPDKRLKRSKMLFSVTLV